MGIDAAAAEVQSVIEPQAGRLQFPCANCGLLAGGTKERTNFRVRVWKRTLNAKPYGNYRSLCQCRVVQRVGFKHE